MGVFSAPMPASGPQRPDFMLSWAALLGPTPLPCRQPMACSSRMPARSHCCFRILLHRGDSVMLKYDRVTRVIAVL